MQGITNKASPKVAETKEHEGANIMNYAVERTWMSDDDEKVGSAKQPSIVSWLFCRVTPTRPKKLFGGYLAG